MQCSALVHFIIDAILMQGLALVHFTIDPIFMQLLLLLLLGCSPVSSDRTDEYSRRRQQKVSGDPRDYLYSEGMCVCLIMDRVTGTLPLCGELCVYLCDKVGMCLIL